MELLLKREAKGQDWTFGKLYVNGKYECETLEDKIRTIKIKKQTAIPAGRYQIGLHDSPRFGRIVPILKNVPNFTYVLIHWGNFIENTDGCILVGTGRRGNAITDSRKSFNLLFPQIEAALKRGEEVWLTITQ